MNMFLVSELLWGLLSKISRWCNYSEKKKNEGLLKGQKKGKKLV